MPIPTDLKLYAVIKEKVYRDNPVHSAYRSGRLVQEYKRAFSAKYGSKSPYQGQASPRAGLRRWFDEEWRNQRGEVGYSRPDDVYRPTRRITVETPLTFDELTERDLRAARAVKRRTGRVRRF